MSATVSLSWDTSLDTRATLPPKKNLFYRILRHPLAMPYHRLAVFVVALNLYVFIAVKPADAIDLVIGNFAVAILIRQQLVINALFFAATSLPVTWPLALRWACGKVYHFGGIHVGCFLSGSLWLLLYASNLAQKPGPMKPPFLEPLVWIHLAILITVMLVALPKFRMRYHNLFEVVARFGNWISLALFGLQTLLLNQHQNEGDMGVLLSSPHFWILFLLTFSIALPWMYLKRVPVKLVRPSSHVVLASFDYGVTPFAGSSTELSRSPLLEWHSFANVPTPGKDGFRLTISRAGDWTGKLIDELPEKIWVKGIPTAGVGNIEKLFKRVIWVATGSGIGPCLPHLLAEKVPSRLVWSTRNPVKTYGEDLVNEILAVQPDSVIWDTDRDGKPDLLKLAFQAYHDFDAEAVICIANKKVTWHIVEEFESRGIPAFGAIWDS